MIDLRGMMTESRNPESMNLDEMTALEIVSVMNSEDMKVPQAINSQLPMIAQAVDCCVSGIRRGGRIIYIGAGTSGRLGIVDASECPPTFGVSPDIVVGLMAGGMKAMVKAVEGAEDSLELCAEDLKKLNLKKEDTVVGIAASGRTPYVIGGLEYANSLGCNTVSVACNANSAIGKVAKVKIEVVVGPEVLTGSTRLKAGTAQKLVLNMISTATMIRLGKCYQNLMVDVVQSNAKLRVRAQNIVIDATGVNRDTAIDVLEKAGGSVKTAIVMILASCSCEEAQKRLEASEGHVRQAVMQ
ncbi:MAG: N-acetylmuramic acid 6-phosphate etherase [Spirochaetales bacterium]|nr:N-acetylmuramic acid 6-phosphate etherase [Spirochaetales bacterium]